MWQTIKDFLTKLVARIKKAYNGLSPDSVEGGLVADMTDSLQKLYDLWTDALADAGKKYSVLRETDTDSGYLYHERDFPIDPDVEKMVNKALAKSNSSMHDLSPITPKQIKRIHRLGTARNDIAYRGNFEGGTHLFSDIAIRHIISEHGDFLREALRAQLPMTTKDIARHLSAIKSDKEPSNIIPTRTGRGQASILTLYKVNGYTLFAEEITKKLGNKLPSDLIGHTMYKAPTLATAISSTTSVKAPPKRQSTVLCNYYKPNSKDLSIGNFVQNSNGRPALLNYISLNGSAKQDFSASGLISLSSDASNFTDKSGKIEQGYVRCNKPFYITADNRVFSNSDTNVSEKINELKKQGYDCFIFEKTPGDNYMVAVVNKAQIVKDEPTVTTNEGKQMLSDRNPNSVSNRTLLANVLESVAQNDIERKKLAQYKDKISLIESEQEKLAEIRAEIKELSFAKGKRDTAKIKELQFEANKTANRINTYDRQILNLESTAALKGVLEREKQMAYQKAKKEGKEALARQRERAAKVLLDKKYRRCYNYLDLYDKE